MITGVVAGKWNISFFLFTINKKRLHLKVCRMEVHHYGGLLTFKDLLTRLKFYHMHTQKIYNNQTKLRDATFIWDPLGAHLNNAINGTLSEIVDKNTATTVLQVQGFNFAHTHVIICCATQWLFKWNLSFAIKNRLRYSQVACYMSYQLQLQSLWQEKHFVISFESCIMHQ